MRKLFYIAMLCSALLKAQDKLFFNNGTSKTGFIVSMSKDLVYFKLSDTSIVERIKKADLIMAQDYKGTRYIFGEEQNEKDRFKPTAQKIKYRNFLGIQPFAFFLGRATLVYERVSDDGRIGIVIPVSLTFDPYPTGNKPGSSFIQGPQKTSGLNVIGGCDVNFYIGDLEQYKFFIGPRVRYGTDVLLYDTEGLTLQTQFGWKFGNPASRFVQHLSAGFGFARIISSAGVTSNSRQLFGWYSINYRISVRW